MSEPGPGGDQRPLVAEVATFFDDFVRSFFAFDGARIAARYHAPGASTYHVAP